MIVVLSHCSPQLGPFGVGVLRDVDNVSVSETGCRASHVTVLRAASPLHLIVMVYLHHITECVGTVGVIDDHVTHAC